MKNRSTLILFFLAVVAIGYFFLIEQPRHHKHLTTEAEALLLTTALPDDVTKVVIERPDVVLDFVRAGDGWVMQLPVADAADAASVNVLLYSITGGRIERRMQVEKGDLEGFGLKPPEAVVLLIADSGDTLVDLDVGSLTMTKEYAYARLAGSSEVLLAPTGIRRYALRPTFEFRSKLVADFEDDNVTTFTLATRDHAMRWWKTDDGHWFTQQRGDTLRGDTEKVIDIMKRLVAIRAGGFVDDSADSARHFEKPVGTITVELGKRVERFAFARADSAQCYISTTTARRVARVDNAILDVFALQLGDLRDRHVLSFDADTVASITLEAGDFALSIVKHGPEWTFTNPSFGDLDQAAVRVLLKELENMLFRKIMQERLRDPAAWGLDPAPYRLSLFDAEDRLIDYVHAGSVHAEGGIRYATSRSRHLGTVDTEPLDEIEGLFKDFRSGRSLQKPTKQPKL